MTESLDTTRTLVSLTAGIVAGYAATNKCSGRDLSDLITIVHDAWSGLEDPKAESQDTPIYKPAVSVRKAWRIRMS